MYLRKATASQEILLGQFVDSVDGNTAETGLTIANTDIKLWKGGATTLASKNSGGATHISGGNYYAVLDATDTDTVGMLEVVVSVSGAMTVIRRYYVLEQAVYDAMFAASATGVPASLTTAIDALPTLAEILAGGDVDGYTVEGTLKLLLAALAGKVSGGGTTTVTIRAADDSKARVTATVDSSGNRSALTLDATG